MLVSRSLWIKYKGHEDFHSYSCSEKMLNPLRLLDCCHPDLCNLVPLEGHHDHRQNIY